MINSIGAKKVMRAEGKCNMSVNIPKIHTRERCSMNIALLRHLEDLTSVKACAPAKQRINLLLL